MISIFKFENGNDTKVGEYETQNEHEAIQRYVKSINGKMENFKFQGECRGIVYGMHFSMTVNGKTNEYYLIQR